MRPQIPNSIVISGKCSSLRSLRQGGIPPRTPQHIYCQKGAERREKRKKEEKEKNTKKTTKKKNKKSEMGEGENNTTI